MKPQEFKAARLNKGWTQTQAAARLGITQAYLNFLENGKRRLTPKLVGRATSVYGLSPDSLPVPANFVPQHSDNQRLSERLAKLGYPGFLYLHSHTPKENPSQVLLEALWQDSLDGRVAEALPWVALNYAGPDMWLVENARKLNLQNRLGFVVNLAQRVAEKQGSPRLTVLNELEKVLNDSRLAKEDVFYRLPRTEGEREWLMQNRTTDAAHWNLLADMKPEHLQYAV
jgi:transcriptional regulator with XRE-family HTH domain